MGLFITFNGPNGTELSVLDSDFTEHTSYTINSEVYTNRLIQSAAGNSCYYHSWTPVSANYSVLADLYVETGVGHGGPAGRIDTGANTMYQFRYQFGSTAFRLFKIVAGVATQLGSNSAATLTNGQTYMLELKMNGDQISGYVDGVLKVGPITDTAITAKGKAGIRLNGATSIAGYHLDNLRTENKIKTRRFIQNFGRLGIR